MKKVDSRRTRLMDAKTKRCVRLMDAKAKRYADRVVRRYTDSVVTSIVERAKGLLEKAAGMVDSSIQRLKKENDVSSIKELILAKKKLIGAIALLTRIPNPATGAASVVGVAGVVKILSMVLPLISAAAVILVPLRGLATLAAPALAIKGASALIKKAIEIAKSSPEEA